MRKIVVQRVFLLGQLKLIATQRRYTGPYATVSDAYKYQRRKEQWSATETV